MQLINDQYQRVLRWRLAFGPFLCVSVSGRVSVVASSPQNPLTPFRFGYARWFGAGPSHIGRLINCAKSSAFGTVENELSSRFLLLLLVGYGGNR